MRIFTTLLVLLLAIHAWSQDKPQVELVDEFGRQHCEEVKARVDNLMIQLMAAKPGSRALISIRGKENDVIENLRFQELIRGSLAVRRYDESRVDFVRVGTGSALLIQFRIIPGGIPSGIEAAPWDLSFGSTDKPFAVGADYSSEDDICGPFETVRIFGELLKQNEHSRGNIVIRPGSQYQSAGRRKLLLRTLAQTYGTEPRRIRFFWAKPGNVPKWQQTETEYWLLP